MPIQTKRGEQMSILIDDLKEQFTCHQYIANKWYVAKPLGNKSLLYRLKDAWKIITKKAIAVHYKEDEVNQ